MIPGRNCGECTVCCRDLTIDVPELRKLPHVSCEHCRDAGGCSIYESRPSVCKNFYCGWRMLPQLGDAWRPDVSEILIEMTKDDIPRDYPQRGLKLTVLGSPQKVNWPPLVLLIGSYVANGVPMFLAARGTPGYLSGKVFLNEVLKPAVALRDWAGVTSELARALHACRQHPQEAVRFS